METVQQAILKAVSAFGGDDGTFNSAGFAHAFAELAGVATHLNLPDGKIVAAILKGRGDVAALPGGAHYRYLEWKSEAEKRKHIRTVCCDFDGVLHSYDSGYKGPCEIPDPPVPGAFDWLESMARDGRFQVCVYSSRSKEPGAIEAMIAWFKTHGLPWETISQLRFPTQKPAAIMTIDDRALCFAGTFPTKEWLIDFKPWNKKRS